MDVYLTALLFSTLLAVFFSRKYTVITSRNLYTVSRIREFGTAFLAMLPLTLVAAFRWNVGVDSLFGGSYYSAYHQAAMGLNPRGFEIGYFLFSAIFSVLKFPYFWYLFIQTTVYMICTSYSISKISVSPALSIITFVLMQPYFDSFSALRQALAQAICLVALAYWMSSKAPDNDRKRDGIYLICILIASLFHTISLLYILLFFVCKPSYGQKPLLVISLILVAATPILGPAFNFVANLFSRNNYDTVGFASSYTLISLMIFGLCLWRYYDIVSIDRRAVFLINHALVTFILMLNSSSLVLPYRIYDALKICYIFTIPYVVKSFRSKHQSLIVAIVLVAIMAVFYLNSMYGNDSVFRNYQSIFDYWSKYSFMY